MSLQTSPCRCKHRHVVASIAMSLQTSPCHCKHRHIVTVVTNITHRTPQDQLLFILTSVPPDSPLQSPAASLLLQLSEGLKASIVRATDPMLLAPGMATNMSIFSLLSVQLTGMAINVPSILSVDSSQAPLIMPFAPCPWHQVCLPSYPSTISLEDNPNAPLSMPFAPCSWH